MDAADENKDAAVEAHEEVVEQIVQRRRVPGFMDAAAAAAAAAEVHNDNNNNDDDDTVEPHRQPIDGNDDDDEEEEGGEEVVFRTCYTYPNDFQWPSSALDNIADEGAPICLIIDPSCTEILDFTVRSCRTLVESILFLEGSRVITIGRSAFEKFFNLKRIINGLPRGLIELEVSAFQRCRSLADELVLPSSVRFVRMFCFAKCYSLTSIVFEPSTNAVELGSHTFEECTGVTTVTLPLNLPEIPEECFRECTSLTDIPVPNTVKVLGWRAFSGCTSLMTMDLRDNKILFIPVRCFHRCTALADISLPNTTQEIAAKALQGCTSLTTMDFPPSCVVFGSESLWNCTSLHTITIRAISDDVRISNNLLNGCTSLTTINCRPWIWSKILYSMKRDRTFLTKFVSGTLTPLSSMTMYSWYGTQLFEAVNDQPNSLYQILREFQHQIFDTNNNNTTEEETEEEAAASTVTNIEHKQKRTRIE